MAENLYSRTRRRRAEFINPTNFLKEKVGSGGLSEEILNKAQELLEKNTVDFRPLGEMYLNALTKGIEAAKEDGHKLDPEYVISTMLYPAMQIKANGGMFGFPLITKIADKLVHFLEAIEEADIEAVEIVLAFHTTIRAILLGNIKGDGGEHGVSLCQALDKACHRYFTRYDERTS